MKLVVILFLVVGLVVCEDMKAGQTRNKQQDLVQRQIDQLSIRSKNQQQSRDSSHYQVLSKNSTYPLSKQNSNTKVDVIQSKLRFTESKAEMQRKKAEVIKNRLIRRKFRRKLKRFLQKQLHYLSTIEHENQKLSKKDKNEQQKSQQYSQIFNNKFQFKSDEMLRKAPALQTSPFYLEAELLDRLQKDIDDDWTVHIFDSDYDVRQGDFNCNYDKIKGELLMIDEIILDRPDQQNSIQFKNLNVVVDNQQIYLKDKDSTKSVVAMADVYPKVSMIQQIVESKSALKNVELQNLKIKLYNISQMSQKEESMFCLFLINGGVEKDDQFRELFNHKYMSQLVIEKINIKNELKNNLLGLCHSNYEYIKKWNIFLNREKIECLVEFSTVKQYQ